MSIELLPGFDFQPKDRTRRAPYTLLRQDISGAAHELRTGVYAVNRKWESEDGSAKAGCRKRTASGCFGKGFSQRAVYAVPG